MKVDITSYTSKICMQKGTTAYMHAFTSNNNNIIYFPLHKKYTFSHNIQFILQTDSRNAKCKLFSEPSKYKKCLQNKYKKKNQSLLIKLLFA